MIEPKKLIQPKFFFLALYLAAMLFLVFFVWNQQNTVLQGGNTPLYRNLRESPAFARKGFEWLYGFAGSILGKAKVKE